MRLRACSPAAGRRRRRRQRRTRPALAPPRCAGLHRSGRPAGGRAEATNIEALAQSIAGVDDPGGLIVAEIESSAPTSRRRARLREGHRALARRRGRRLPRALRRRGLRAARRRRPDRPTQAQPGLHRQAGESSDDRSRTAPTRASTTRSTSDDGEAVGIDRRLRRLRRGRADLQGSRRRLRRRLAGRQRGLHEVVDDRARGQPCRRLRRRRRPDRQSGGAIDPEAQRFFDSRRRSTPGSDRRGRASSRGRPDRDRRQRQPRRRELAERRRLAACSARCRPTRSPRSPSADVGDTLGEAIDQIDADGIPGEVPPSQLKNALERAGIDLDEDRRRVGDVGVFVEGNGQAALGGALVIETDDAERSAQHASRTSVPLLAPAAAQASPAMSGAARLLDPQPASSAQPLVSREDDRIAIGYGEDARRPGGGRRRWPATGLQEAATRSADAEPTASSTSGGAAPGRGLRPDVTGRRGRRRPI